MRRKRLITTFAAIALLIVSWIAGAELAGAQNRAARVTAGHALENLR
jgi:hypothetical protein